MTSWDKFSFSGKRGSDRPIAAPVARRDRLLEAVIAQEQVEVLYQPQIELATGQVVGVEALARWGRGDADKLFKRAAAAGLTERLSRLMQRKALRAAATWEGPIKDLKLSINLMPQDICRTGYEDWLLEEAESAGVDPKRLTVEITESTLLDDDVAVPERLSRLRAAGLRVAIDDFGSGYASLAYLTNLPIDIIKVDRALTAEIGASRGKIVMQALIRLAHDLGLEVLVEGVETVAQLDLLQDWRCDFYQGFLGAGALNEAELWRFVAAINREAA